MRFIRGKHRQYAILLAATVGIVLVAGAALVLTRASSREFSFTLTTESLPELAPHEHGLGESDTDPGHAVYVNSPVYVVPEDMWVTALEYTTHNAPNNVIHHATIMDLSRGDPFCPSEPLVLISVDHQNDTKHTYPRPTGIYLKKGTRLFFRSMLHNPVYPEGPGETYHDVSVSMTVTGVPPGAGRYKDLDLVYLALTDEPNCPFFEFTVPAQEKGFIIGPKDFATSSPGIYTFPTDGRIVIHGAHLHPWDGALSLNLFINEVKRFSYIPRRTGPEAWEWWTPSSYEPITVHKGDRLWVNAVYDNPLPVPLRGAMGIQMFGYYRFPACTNDLTRLLRKLNLYECTP
jgi:hypothetical protein